MEDFDYLNMPEKEDDTLTITVTTDAAEKDGLYFSQLIMERHGNTKGLFR